jgi:hypothetical protein
MPKKHDQAYITDFINNTGEIFVDGQEYKNEQQLLRIICQGCSKEYKKTWNNFRVGSRCPECAEIQRHIKRRVPFDIVRETIKQAGDELLSESEVYKNNRSELSIKCGKCDTVYSKSYEDFNRKDKPRRCTECSKKNQQSLVKISEEDVINTCLSNRLHLLTSYVEIQNVKQNLHFECANESCHYQFSTTLDGIRSKKTGCPKCKASYGEKQVINILEKMQRYGAIQRWSKEYRFVDTLSPEIRNLSFDFIVYTVDGIFIIEFDGIQHFQPTSFAASCNAEEHFKGTNRRDKMKNKYCADNKISILRICYLDVENVTGITINFLNVFTQRDI